jgi:hypothetical protein
VRYSSIDDAVKIIQRLGRGAKLSKCDIKSTFRLLRIFPGDFDQLGFFFRINIILINVHHHQTKNHPNNSKYVDYRNEFL